MTGRIPALIAFQTPPFRRLFGVTILGTFSQGAIFTILGWVIVEETGSAVQVSLVIATFLAPQVVAAPIGGALADRFGRSLILRGGMAVRAGQTALLAVVIFWDPSATWALFVLNAASSVVSGATVPARRAMTADVVPRSHLTSAISMEEFGISAGFLISPFAAGFLLAVVEPELLMAAVMGFFALAAVLVPSTKTDDGEREVAAPSLAAVFRGGLAFAWSNPVVRGVLVVGLLGELLAFNYIALIPIFATEVFDGGSALLGSMEGTISVGETLGVVVVASFAGRIVRTGRAFIVGAAAAPAVGIPLALTTSLPSAFALLALLGATAAMFGVLQSKVIIEAIPASARARLLGVQQMTWGAGAVGSLAAGGLATATSPAVAVAGLSAAGLAGVLVVAVVSPGLRGSGAGDRE